MTAINERRLAKIEDYVKNVMLDEPDEFTKIIKNLPKGVSGKDKEIQRYFLERLREIFENPPPGGCLLMIDVQIPTRPTIVIFKNDGYKYATAARHGIPNTETTKYFLVPGPEDKK